MEKEKALNTIRKYKENWINEIQEAIETLVPELRESVDVDKYMDMVRGREPESPNPWELRNVHHAASEYADGIIQREDALMCKAAFIAGAKWQKEQIDAIDRCVDYLEESDNEDAEIMESLQEQLNQLKQ